MHVTNSERVAGVGLLNGGAYASLKENGDLLNRDRSTRDIKDFDEYYTKNEEIANADNFIKETNNFEAQGKIDPLINLNDSPVWIASNRRDNVVPAYLQYEQRDFYTNYGAKIEF